MDYSEQTARPDYIGMITLHWYGLEVEAFMIILRMIQTVFLFLLVFVGQRDLFEQYWDDKVLGYDFGFSCDEDFAVIKFRDEPLKQIDAHFDDAELFDLDELKKIFPDGLDKAYNAVYVVGNVNYKGTITEVENDTFGYFKFLGTFSSKQL